MVRPLEIPKHDRQLEIDCAIANGASPRSIGHHFEIDPRTVGSYRDRMLDDDPGYFDRLRIRPPLSHDNELIFQLGAGYAEQRRREYLTAAEAAFAALSN